MEIDPEARAAAPQNVAQLTNLSAQEMADHALDPDAEGLSFLDSEPEIAAMAQMNSGVAQILAALPALTLTQRNSLDTHVHALQTLIQGLHSPDENIRAGPTPGYIANQVGHRELLCKHLLLGVPHRPGVVCTSPNFHRLPLELRKHIFTLSMWMTRFSFVVNDITSNIGHGITYFDNRRRDDIDSGVLSDQDARQHADWIGNFRASDVQNCPILPCSVFRYKSTELVSMEIGHRPDPAGISTGKVEVLYAYSIGNPQPAIRRNTRHIMLVHHPAMNKVVAYEIDDEGDIIRQHNDPEA